MTRQLSPDELDLQREELSEEDWKARVEQLESDPDLAQEVIETLSEAQKVVLRMTYDRGSSTHSGRGGWNVTTMRALEKKGCAKQGKEHRWETDWTLTTRGKTVGRILQRQWLDSIVKMKAK